MGTRRSWTNSIGRRHPCAKSLKGRGGWEAHCCPYVLDAGRGKIAVFCVFWRPPWVSNNLHLHLHCRLAFFLLAVLDFKQSLSDVYLLAALGFKQLVLNYKFKKTFFDRESWDRGIWLTHSFRILGGGRDGPRPRTSEMRRWVLRGS